MTSVPDERPENGEERALEGAARPAGAPGTGDSKPSGAGRAGPLPEEVRRAAGYTLDRKAEAVTVLDLRPVSSTTDFFVIATGRSDLHVQAIAEHVLDSVRADGDRPEHVEGLDQGRWVLIDYIDYVVHIFHPAVRDFYRLEVLWGDAPSATFGEAVRP